MAALAAGGFGGDATRLDAAERARLRGQALVWLRDDLGLWGKQLEAGGPQVRDDAKFPISSGFPQQNGTSFAPGFVAR